MCKVHGGRRATACPLHAPYHKVTNSPAAYHHLPAGPADVRAGATLGFEDALGLTRSLSLLGGDYLPVARQLLKVGGVPLGWHMPDGCLVVVERASSIRQAMAERLHTFVAALCLCV